MLIGSPVVGRYRELIIFMVNDFSFVSEGTSLYHTHWTPHLIQPFLPTIDEIQRLLRILCFLVI